MTYQSDKTAFLAGASGAIGRALIPLLVADGWRVVGTTRRAERAADLRALGAEPVVLDVYDAAALTKAVVACAPQVVFHQLTDLPPGLAADQMPAALPRNARIREEGTRNLIAAAVAAGAKRFVAQSVSFAYAPGNKPYREEDPLNVAADGATGVTVRGVASLETQTLEAPLVGIVLRYARLYGSGTGFDNPVPSGYLHVREAARAALLAAHQGEAGIYNIAEDEADVVTEKARRVLGWTPTSLK